MVKRRRNLRYCYALGFFCAFLFCGFLVQSAEDKDQGWLQRSKGIIKHATKQDIPAWLRTNVDSEAQSFAEAIAKDAMTKLPEEITSMIDRKELDEKQKRQVVAFVSFSMPDAALKSLLNAASGEEVIVVVRGMKPGSGQLIDTLKEFHRLGKGIDPLPKVTINPPLFKEHDIQVVPTLLTGHGTDSVVRTRGTIAIDWFRKQAAAAERKGDVDLGKQGETYEIAEIDMIEYMQTKIAQIDWEQKKKNAIANFWKKRPDKVSLPPAREDKVFTVDPSFVVTEDVILPDGTVLALRGEQINPLHQLTFSKTIIVFNGVSKKQMALAKQEAQKARAQGKGLLLVTTEVDEELGWKSFEDMHEFFQYRIYVLDTEMAERFHLTHTPSVISRTGDVFEIRELKVPL